SLPEQGLLARVQVAPFGKQYNDTYDKNVYPPCDVDGGIIETPHCFTPQPTESGMVPLIPQRLRESIPAFLMDGPDVAVPQFFRVPTPSAAEPDAAVADSAYEAICGLGYNYEAEPLELPAAPRATATGAPQPRRMRYDANTGLLFVSDRSLPV